MSKKGGNFLENHVEKLVLGVASLVCVWVFTVNVLLSPNSVELNGRDFSPGEVDSYIRRQSVNLEDKIEQAAIPVSPPDQRCKEFLELTKCAVAKIDTSLSVPLPAFLGTDVRKKGRYDLPVVGRVGDVVAEHIRAVAYMPTAEVTADSLYDQVDHEPNDLDIVTVEARFDVAQLYQSFYESFAGERLKQEWRDPCLAKPVFAAVNLERQEAIADGSWGQWESVPRTRIDHNRERFEIIEDAAQLPAGGIQVRMFQYDNAQLRVDLLQPQAYAIASANEEWFPPSLHRKYLEVLQKMEDEEKRLTREAELLRKEQEKERLRGGAKQRSVPGAVEGSPGSVGSVERFMEEAPDAIFGTRRSPAGGSARREKDREREAKKREIEEKRRQEKEKAGNLDSVQGVYDELKGILLMPETKLDEMREPLVFWAHDDTVEPDETYRYRVRLGVFNPLAGSPQQLADRSVALADKAILWSEYSVSTEPIYIPGVMYFFPTTVQETAGAVRVEVAKFVLGYWYTQEFNVEQGEVIGAVVENQLSDKKKVSADADDVTLPEKIDYGTGAVLLDFVPVDDLAAGSVSSRRYFDVLYTFDGSTIEHRPVETRYWDGQLRSQYNEIKKSQKEPKEPLRPWGAGMMDRRIRYVPDRTRMTEPYGGEYLAPGLYFD